MAAFDYESIFGSDFTKIRASLASLPPQVETMLLGTMGSMIYGAEIFAKNLEAAITQMAANGINSTVITQTLTTDQATGGRIFGQLRNDTKGSIAMGISNSGRIGQYEDYTKNDIFAWVTVAGHKVCVDCSARGGLVMPYKDWDSEGVPGSGWSVCKGYCYCVLDPTGKASDNVKGTTIAEPGTVAAGQRAAQRFIPLNWHQANAYAKQLLKGAGLSEAEITAMMNNMAKKHGGVMEGLKFKMKGRSSTIRKIMKENSVNRWGRQSLMREDLNDLNRYTMLFDEAAYTRSVGGVIADMEASGFQFVKIKNTWSSQGYKGINCNVVAPDGRVFELQFHSIEIFRQLCVQFFVFLRIYYQ